MIVLVESNFVLELALRQEQVDDAERIVGLAEAKAVELVVPGCSLFEPYETLIRRRKERALTQERLLKELRQLSRSKEFTDLLETSKNVTRALAESGEVEARGLDTTIRRLLDIATVLPLTAEVVGHALDAQVKYDLEPQDAVVFASVDFYLQPRTQSTKVFANRNYADFAKPDIESHLAEHNCKLFPDFHDAKNFVEHELAERRS